MDEVKVSISIITYNQENYIKDTIEGVLSQKVDFKYEILLGEDGSSDGTRAICQEYARLYPDIIRLFLHDRENVIYMDGIPTGRYNFLYNIHQAKGEYIAFCDGDDYWTNPLKLQNQTEFLDNNPDYALVHGNYKKLNQNNNSFEKATSPPKKSGDVFLELLQNNFISTHTVYVRKKILNQIDLQNLLADSGFLMADYPLWLEISRHNKIHYLEEELGVYRNMENSASRSSNYERESKFGDSVYSIRNYFANKYNVSRKFKRKILQMHIERLARIAFKYKMNYRAKLFIKKINLGKILGIKMKIKCLLIRNNLLWRLLLIFDFNSLFKKL